MPYVPRLAIDSRENYCCRVQMFIVCFVHLMKSVDIFEWFQNIKLENYTPILEILKVKGLDKWMSCICGDMESDTSKEDMEKYFSLMIDDLSKSILCAIRSSMNLLVEIIDFGNQEDDEQLNRLLVQWDSFIDKNIAKELENFFLVDVFKNIRVCQFEERNFIINVLGQKKSAHKYTQVRLLMLQGHKSKLSPLGKLSLDVIEKILFLYLN